MKLVQTLIVLVLCIVIVNASCASWALRKYSDDYLECMNKNPTATGKRSCLRDWKYSISDTDCTDEKFKELYQEFCNAHDGGALVCDI
ncbi:hypothetical protein KM1_246860 [Entamoeba histolytica HM-3:IMSS]|uniref:Uncharacterized protein n=2 Tax=Entamoeba histolytica TaxID=5759 RepID=M7W4I5_ENTHI|nr:hypothetical protein KM1_246860 [Entamoeba histolytica HM-3:IMSS]GAT99335.1 similar to quiescin q6 sulfhydryl oxidase 2 [Entamoeba histolytica]GAT99669.1 similar to quiescin q6 sulfhydryl oxidase 2 [Entamoeba histolytica]